ncbi:MAG: LysR family transcriptional regulator [Traorella sp.]
MLPIRHFKIFKVVCETENMSEAAKRLYISQPTVSQTISEIEKYYDTKLFERYPKKLSLTNKGKILLEYTNYLIDAYDKVNQLSLHQDDFCHIRIGATYTVSACILNDIMNSSLSINSNIDYYVNVDNTASLENKLLKNELDFILVDGIIKSNDIITVPIADDCLVLVCGPAHPFANKKHVSIKDMNNQHVILREEGSGTRKLFESEMLAHNIKYQIKWECNDMQAIKKAVMNNQGIAIISARLIKEELENKQLFLVNIRECIWKKDIFLCYYKNKYLTEFNPFIQAATSFYVEGVKCPIVDEIGCN